MIRKLALLLPLTLACSDGNKPGAGECSANADCSSGAICENGVCKTLCAVDRECASGEICVSSTCVAGARELPTITTIDGDGAVVCPDADGSHCIAAGLLVHGTHLEGATFQLVSGAGPLHELTARAGATDTYAELDLPSSVETGAHTLRVTNGAGSADQTFQFLQGPAGPAGQDGSPDTAQQILDKLVTVAGPGSLLDADMVDGNHLQDIIDQIPSQVPPGTIVAFGGNTAPSGWLICDGSEVDRTQYADLFAAIGVTHGGGDLINTFHLPDLRGRFMRGVDAGAGNDPDAAGRAQAAVGGNSGDAVGSIQGDGYGSHQHNNTWSRVHDCSSSATGTNDSFWSNGCSRSSTTSVQASGGNETRPKNVSVTFVIKY